MPPGTRGRGQVPLLYPGWSRRITKLRISGPRFTKAREAALGIWEKERSPGSS